MKSILIICLGFYCITLSAYIPYEKHFKIYTLKYFKNTPLQKEYLLFASQAKQESRFDSLAKSPVGAEGLMQFMPLTWKDMNTTKERTSAKYSIKYGVKYDRQLWNIWKADRPVSDRVSFMLASYNAGAGNIIKAQKVAKETGLNPNLWANIIIALPVITKHHSSETITYVKRIWRYYYEYTRTRNIK